MNKKKKKFFGDIVLQQKSLRDWRAYVHCRDSEGDWWELRAIAAETPEQAASNAWECYCKDEKLWDNYGYVVDFVDPMSVVKARKDIKT